LEEEETMEMMGWSLTSLTRARLPFSGVRPEEENLTLRFRVGVNVDGMIAEGRRLALFSESRREVLVDIVGGVLLTCFKMIGGLEPCDEATSV
jgi:hypothetical protein